MQDSDEKTQPQVAPSVYTTDVKFPSTFGAYQAPVHMHWTSAVMGAVPGPVRGDFAYCDLGCGNGMTLNVIAVSYPEARFYGVDINTDHIADGRSLAARGGIPNTTFVNASFADLANQDLPQFDYITIAGIYSWLSFEMRSAITAFLKSHLKPGGYLYIHYSALPGSAVMDALYTYIQTVVRNVEGDSVQRFSKGLEVAHRLKDANALLFRAHPMALAQLNGISQHNPEGMAHEVLNSQIHSLYHHEVRAEMAKAELEFVAQARLEANYPELVMPRVAAQALQRISEEFPDPIVREASVDWLLNQTVRMELYRKRGGDGGDPHTVLDGLYLHRFAEGDEGPARQRITARTGIDLLSPPIGTILKTVGRKSMSIGELMASDALAGFERPAIQKAIEKLVAVKLVNVLLRPAPLDKYVKGGRYRFPSPLNEIALNEYLLAPDPVPFASPVVGTRLLIPQHDRMRVLAILGGNLGAVWKEFQEKRVKVTDPQGKEVTSYERFREHVDNGLGEFAERAIPELLRLGILAPA